MTIRMTMITVTSTGITIIMTTITTHTRMQITRMVL